MSSTQLWAFNFSFFLKKRKNLMSTFEILDVFDSYVQKVKPLNCMLVFVSCGYTS